MNRNIVLEQDAQWYNNTDKYSHDNFLVLNAYSKRIMELLQKRGSCEELSLLELGLGHGYTTLQFEGKFAYHSVVEGDREVIDIFKQNNKNINVEIIHSFFEDFECDKKIDVIVAGFILEHVDNPEQIVKKYRDYLSENGKMYIAVPNAEALNRRIGYESGLLNDMFELSESDQRVGHKRYFCKESILSLCKESGLKVNLVEGLYLKPLTYSQMESLNLSEEIYNAFCTVGRLYPELCTGMLLECEIER